MKSLPKRLSIAGSEWLVKRAWPGKTKALSESRCAACQRPLRCDDGSTDPNSKTITIALGLRRRSAWVALLHEVLHAVDYETAGDWGAGDKIKEQLIERIDDPLFALLNEAFGVGR
jgi:hypothetical protein